MSRHSSFELYDRILGGTLTSLLLAWRADGVTLDEQSLQLRDHGVTVSRETVRRWQAAVAAPDEAAS